MRSMANKAPGARAAPLSGRKMSTRPSKAPHPVWIGRATAAGGSEASGTDWGALAAALAAHRAAAVPRLHRATSAPTTPPASRARLRLRHGPCALANGAPRSMPRRRHPSTTTAPPAPAAARPAAAAAGGDMAAAAARLERLFAGGGGALTGAELTELIRGNMLPACAPRRAQVMWKFLEQQSFHLTREEYDAQMAAVADLVSEWGAADIVRRAIAADKSRGPGYTAGGSARAVSIYLP
ncbi:MAG: hypothetical protein J3K34DRAFT_456758, partial [Monoraphidium minutum]